MLQFTLKANVADRTIVVRIVDSTTGVPETGVAYNAAGMAMQYWKVGANSLVNMTGSLAALTNLNDAHSDYGWKEIGYGYYRLDLPDAATSTVGRTIVVGTVTDMIVIGAVIDCVAYDPADTVRLGLTALPNAAVSDAGGLQGTTYATTLADTLLKRDMSSVTGESARSPLNALRLLRNKTSISGATLTVTKEDDSTSAWTAAVTSSGSANPITGIDPA